MLKARDYNPSVKHGAKWLPSDLAGMIGQPVVNNIFYVDANGGSDTANSGTSWDDALATLGAAEDKCVSYNYDVIIVAPSANSVTTEGSITWNKSFITVVGANAPIHTGQRSRVGFGSSATTPCFNITGTANRFLNLKLVVEEDVNVMVNVAGDRNSFQDVDLCGICNATTGDDAAARVLTITEKGENYFLRCNFGVDTIALSGANAQVALIGNTGCRRNMFEDCMFRMYADSSDARHVLFTGSYSSETYTWFKNCFFYNGGTSTLTVGMTVPTATNGKVILDGCSIYGSTDWADDYTCVYGMNMPDITAANSGFLEQIAT